MSLIETLARSSGAPRFLGRSIQYLALMGSHAFGTANEQSDRDVYGWCIQPVRFRRSFEEFEVLDLPVRFGDQGVPHDFKIYGVHKFFDRCTEGKSQSLETLFVADTNVLYMTPAARLVREHRRLFLHCGTARKFREFAYQQLDGMVHHKFTDGKRKQYIERFGYDVKAGYHVVRLMCEALQILRTGDLDLRANRDLLLQIRAGDWSVDDIVHWFAETDAQLEKLYKTCGLPETVNRKLVNDLRQKCLHPKE